ncbi:universal stress protein [Actinospica sp. MGRD01-02]|uniref:Universal stress protein n=1 Tax=Actinospica acidithermotolerans TaxID=2828514 RepID=A0A941IIT9_9ACTN|nr:universal stress protein [Actinospica acidithermotolerans]MBR7827142.1 universal stress protein [Actinospica acidithermotolerans]
MVEDEIAPFIVVGVDGAASSREALRWAARQARLTKAELHAIRAWDFPVTYGWTPDYSDVDLAAQAHQDLAMTITQVLGDLPDVPIVVRVEQGPATAVLVEASRGADLLVVGSRGHGAFDGMLLGSVSQHCAQHAVCPVVIVPPQQD